MIFWDRFVNIFDEYMVFLQDNGRADNGMLQYYNYLLLLWDGELDIKWLLYLVYMIIMIIVKGMGWIRCF